MSGISPSLKTGKDILDTFIRCSVCGSSLSRSNERFACGTCSAVYSIRNGQVFFTTPPDDIQAPARSRTPETWSRWRRANYEYYKENLASIPDTARVVDIGAGPSQFLGLFDRFKAYVGVDFLPYDSVSVVADLNKSFPLQNQCVDVVILSNVLEHTQEPSHVLAECVRILAPGGILLETTPFLVSLHQVPYDFNRYTLYQHKYLLEKAGLKDVIIKPLGSPACAYDTLERKFFVVLSEARPYKSKLKNSLFTIIARTLRVLVRGISKCAGPFYRLVPPSPLYTEGYAGLGYKPQEAGKLAQPE